jgi:predicted small secreted protein
MGAERLRETVEQASDPEYRLHLPRSRTRKLKEDDHMKHNISIAVAALAIVLAGCNARPGSANKVTVAGCVQSAEQGLAAGDAKDINKFMLTNAAASGAEAPAPASAPAPAPGDQARSDQARSDPAAPPAAAPTTASTLYMLDGKASELRPHLNHQVEITGRLDEAKDSSSATIDRRPELHVDSVRMIAATCNQ